MERNRQKSDIIGPNLFNRKRIIILNSEKKNLKLTRSELFQHSKNIFREILQRKWAENSGYGPKKPKMVYYF